MKKTLIVLAATSLTSLTACGTMFHDDFRKDKLVQDCVGYGFKQGTQQNFNCVMRLESEWQANLETLRNLGNAQSQQPTELESIKEKLDRMHFEQNNRCFNCY